MPYTTVELLVGALVVACLLLLYCKGSKPVDGMLHGKLVPGLHMRDGYSNMKRAGTFDGVEGYTVGHAGDKSLSYNARHSYFKEGLGNAGSDQGLNNLETRATPASANVQCPLGNENSILWAPDAAVQQDVYTATLNDHTFNRTEEDLMYKNVFSRETNKGTPDSKSASLGGAILRLTDYHANLHPSRDITM